MIYDDGDTTNDRNLQIAIGNQSRAELIQQYTSYLGGDIYAQLHASDGQPWVDSGVRFDIRAVTGSPVGSTTILDSDQFLDGVSVPDMGNGREGNGSGLWDIHTINITRAFQLQQLQPNTYSVEMVQLPDSNDSLKWIALAIDQPSDGSLTPNQRPVVEDLSYAPPEDTPFEDFFVGSDPDGDTFSFSIAPGGYPEHGTLRLIYGPTQSAIGFSYIPAPNFVGVDTFQYRAYDGFGYSDPATVTIDVQPVNDAPGFEEQTFAGIEDTALNGQLIASDVDGDVLTFSLVNGPVNGSISLNSDGSFEYTPNADFNGEDNFIARVSDGTEVLDRLMTLLVDPVEDAPRGTWNPAPLEENSPVDTLAGQVVGYDPEGEQVFFEVVDGNETGAFRVNAATGEVFVVDPNQLDYETTPQFTMTVRVFEVDGLFVDVPVVIDLIDVDETIPASIDAVPGDAENRLSLSSRTVTIAINTTSEMDINNIDIDSLALTVGGNSFTLTRNKRGVPKISYVDTNGDGIDDQLLATFDVDSTGLEAGTVAATLTGLVDGQEFSGEDTILLEASKKGGGKGGGGNGNGKGNNK